MTKSCVLTAISKKSNRVFIKVFGGNWGKCITILLIRAKVYILLSLLRGMIEDNYPIFQKYNTDDVEILKKYCWQHYLAGGKRESELEIYIPSLDHSIYQEELLSKTHPDTFPLFSQLDKKFHRYDRTWTIPLSQKDVLITVRPIDTFDELKSFETNKSPFCFFNTNVAQLYLYAAHEFTRLLGVWSSQNGTETPVGVLPFLMLGDKKHHPWLYLESAMLNEEILRTSVETTSHEKMPFANALLDIIAVYAAIQVGNLFPVIGTTQKYSKLYGSTLKAFLCPAVSQFSSLSHTNTLELIASREEGKMLMAAKHNGKVWLKLPNDKKLNAFLKENGHSIAYLFSYAFLQDETRKSYYTKEGKRTGWGEMKGETEFVPLLSYIPIFNEKCRLMRAT